MSSGNTPNAFYGARGAILVDNLVFVPVTMPLHFLFSPKTLFERADRQLDQLHDSLFEEQAAYRNNFEPQHLEFGHRQSRMPPFSATTAESAPHSPSMSGLVSML